MNHEEFYARCAALLNSEHDFHEPPGVINRLRHDGTIRNTYKTRWNGREPGNGRFPGHGLIRHYGSMIHVCLNTPPLTGYFKTPEEALAAIMRALGMVDVTVHLAADIAETEAANPPTYEDRAGSVARMRALGIADDRIEEALGITIPADDEADAP